MKHKKIAVLPITALLGLGLLAGCQQADTATTAATNNEQSSDTTAASSDSAAQLHVHDTWAKAAAKGEMTSAFGNIHNENSDAALQIVGAHSSVAESVELHEVVDGTMRAITGGIEIPAGADIDLEPGGVHLMLMGLQKDLLAGDTIEIVLELENNQEFSFTAQIRDYAGALEEYVPENGEHDH